MFTLNTPKWRQCTVTWPALNDLITKNFVKEPTLSQEGIQPQRGALQDVSNDLFVCYQDPSEYVSL